MKPDTNEPASFRVDDVAVESVITVFDQRPQRLRLHDLAGMGCVAWVSRPARVP